MKILLKIKDKIGGFIMMTPEEFERKMKEIAKERHVDDRHYEANCLMANLLKELGYGNGIDVYDEFDKYYV